MLLFKNNYFMMNTMSELTVKAEENYGNQNRALS